MLRNKLLPAALAVCMVLLTSCQQSEQTETVLTGDLILPEQTNYSTVTAEITDYVKTAQGSCTIVFPVQKNLYWETEDSHIQEIAVDRGDEVKAGDVIAVFEVSGSTAEVESLRLQLQRTEEALAEGIKERAKEIRHAERILDYNFTLEKKIATLELEQMQIDYDLFVYEKETEIAQLQKQIAEIEEKLLNNTLVAPFDGIVESVAILNSGDRVDPGTRIATIYSTDTYMLHTSDSADKLRYDMEVTVEAGRKNERKTYNGTVIAAPNILPDEVSLGFALIRMEENVTAEDLQYSPKFFCNSEELHNVLLADRTVLQMENGKYYVNLLEDDMVKKRYVTVGSSNLQQYWILDGLTDGQTLVTD